MVKTEAAIERGDARPEQRGRTVADVLNRFKVEVSPKRRGAKWEIVRCEKLARDSIGRLRLTELQPRHLADWRERALLELKPASVRREMSVLRAALEVARLEWGWLSSNPLADVKRPPLTKPRTRRPSKAEIDALCVVWGWAEARPRTLPQRCALAFLLAIETGMRAGEILTLDSSCVFIGERYVHLDITKNGDDRDVPLSARACELLSLMPPEGIGLTSAQLDWLFRKARNKLKLDNLHFHDTRREACTRLAKKLSVIELARVIGHRDPKSLMIYYQPDVSDLADKL